jgi:hypothetical protein
VGNPEQPRRCGRLAWPVARAREQHRREHLGGQVRGKLGILGATQEEREHGALVAPVELGERRAVPVGRGEQVIVGRDVHCPTD